MTEAFVFDAIRTPRGKGKKDGSLYEVTPVDLLAGVPSELQRRNDFDTAQVDDMNAHRRPGRAGGAMQFIHGMGVDAFVGRAHELATQFGAGFALSDEVKASIRRHQPVY